MSSNTLYRIVVEAAPQQADIDFVGQQLAQFNHANGGDERYRRLTIFVRDDTCRIAGGLVGSLYWGWLAIDLLWIEETLRGQGYGHRLLETAEQEAVAYGCRNAHVDTLSFQAPEFYLKRGYEVFGQIDGLPPGFARYYLKKKLVSA
ncbi:MAG: GNAT family N-acetyltransferase [Anaerolineae bacterium]